MDSNMKLPLSHQLRTNEWFIEGIDELIKIELKKMELGNPNQPEVLVQANISLRAIKKVREYLLAPSEPKGEKSPTK